MPEQNEEEPKTYTISSEGLQKLLATSYRSGALGAFQSLYDAMKMNLEKKKFDSDEQAEGFNTCVSIVETMMVSGIQKLMKNENDV